MHKVLLILLLLLTAGYTLDDLLTKHRKQLLTKRKVVEQTTEQKCSLEYCRRTHEDDCRCRGCCGSKFECNIDRFVCYKTWDRLRRKLICSCNCYACTNSMGLPKPGRTTTPPQQENDTIFSE